MPGSRNGDKLQQGKGRPLNRNGAIVALSGGIDSAVAAHLSQRHEMRVEALYLDLLPDDRGRGAERAARVAELLGIPFHVVDRKALFAEKVLSPFISSYKEGLTPNPCVVCNPLIKIAAGLGLADDRGLRWLVTGHYARITTGPQGPCLSRGMDTAKDQSYFLHQVRRADLDRLWFPLGDQRKDQVRAMASALGLSPLARKESQDVCFLSGDYRTFLLEKGYIRKTPGDIVTVDGRVLGRHEGLFGFTVGQRKGLGIPDATPYYVLALDVPSNRLIVGKDEELFVRSCNVDGINWLVPPETCLSRPVTVKIRSRHPGCLAHLLPGPEASVIVRFERPERAVTPGQYAVFHDGNIVLGGGRICA